MCNFISPILCYQANNAFQPFVCCFTILFFFSFFFPSSAHLILVGFEMLKWTWNKQFSINAFADIYLSRFFIQNYNFIAFQSDSHLQFHYDSNILSSIVVVFGGGGGGGGCNFLFYF